MAAPKGLTGRPSKYNPSFCEMLIAHMRSGLSFESFGGLPEVMVCKDTLYEWANVHKEFSDAKRMGQNCCRLWWERAGQKESKEAIPSGTYRLNMINRFRGEWADRTESNTTLKIEDVGDDELDDRITRLISKAVDES